MDTVSNSDAAEAGEEDSTDEEEIVPNQARRRFRARSFRQSNSTRSTSKLPNEDCERDTRQQRLWSSQDRSDRYQKMLEEAVATDALATDSDLRTSQIGCVIWTSAEKEAFFQALARYSKADITSIARKIGSKSELEVDDFLRLLEEENRCQLLYAKKPPTTDPTEIPAAVEVSRECEILLERQAIALDTHGGLDHTQRSNEARDAKLIDVECARLLDQQAEDEDSEASNKNAHASSTLTAGKFFRLSSWLSLSEQIFMHSHFSMFRQGAGRDTIAEEAPAITHDAATALYKLAVRQLRKILQTTLFCAESRILRARSGGHIAQALVKYQDVVAALDVIGAPEHWLEYWVSLPRRQKLQVVDRRRKNVSGRGRVLQYDQVEQLLSQMPLKKQRHSHIPRSRSRAAIRALRRYGLSLHKEEDDHDSSPEHSNPLQHAAEQAEESLDSTAGPPSVDESHRADETDESHFDTDAETAAIDAADCALEEFDHAVSRCAELQLYEDLGCQAPTDLHNDYERLIGLAKEKVKSTNIRSSIEWQDWREFGEGYANEWEEHGSLLD